MRRGGGERSREPELASCYQIDFVLRAIGSYGGGVNCGGGWMLDPLVVEGGQGRGQSADRGDRRADSVGRNSVRDHQCCKWTRGRLVQVFAFIHTSQFPNSSESTPPQ